MSISTCIKDVYKYLYSLIYINRNIPQFPHSIPYFSIDVCNVDPHDIIFSLTIIKLFILPKLRLMMGILHQGAEIEIESTV